MGSEVSISNKFIGIINKERPEYWDGGKINSILDGVLTRL